jgi:hypothetical protein
MEFGKLSGGGTILEHLRYSWMEVKGFVQRGLYGWAEHDTWSYYSYISRVSVGMLNRLRDAPNGYPIAMVDFTDCEEDQPIIWKAILTTIIEGFEALNEMDEMNYLDLFPMEGNPTSIMDMHWSDDDWAEIKAIEEDLRNTYEQGMDYYREFFLCLWD